MGFALGATVFGALAITAVESVVANNNAQEWDLGMQSARALEAERNAHALRTVEVGAFNGLSSLSLVLALSDHRAGELAREGIDLNAAKRAASWIRDLDQALQVAGFESFDAYASAVLSAGEKQARHEAVDSAHSRIGSLRADDLDHLDRAMRHFFGAPLDERVEIALSSQ